MSKLEDIVSLCKRRGFVFPGSDIYGGMAGTWDFGPLGVMLKNKITAAWWQFWVEQRDDMYGVDAAILMNPRTWEASGHVATFADPLVECKHCHGRFRADKLGSDIPESITSEEFQKLGLECPTCGHSDWSEIRKFNMMFQTHVGPVSDDTSIAYLRPETAQGIFTNFKNVVENTKAGYIYKTTFNGVATPKLGLDKIFPGSQVNGGIVVAILIAIAMYILINKTTLGYELKACGSNRHAARYAGINDKRNIVLSMAIAGALSAGGAALYWLSGNTEFYWSTYQSLPATGFNGIPVALLAVNNPIGVVFTAIFMAMLDIVGQQLTGYTAYNEYITDVIISVIVYLSAFSLVIRMLLTSKRKAGATNVNAEPTPEEKSAQEQARQKGGEQA